MERHDNPKGLAPPSDPLPGSAEAVQAGKLSERGWAGSDEAAPAPPQPERPATSSPPAQRAAGLDVGPFVFVWVTWNVTLAVALLFVDQHVANIPLWDEWSWLDVLSGEKPATPEWLWKPQSEH